jgi:uncharacterized protein YjiS (DUF1127 family)
MFVNGLLKRRRQHKASHQAKKQILNLSEADLADMGIKRYQLELITQG